VKLAFFFIAIIAAVFGFGGNATGAEEIARFLFFLFLAIVVLFLILAAFAGRAIGAVTFGPSARPPDGSVPQP
jgi:uncharacterized membrane protein YtjA (UPF0391 family)